VNRRGPSVPSDDPNPGGGRTSRYLSGPGRFRPVGQTRIENHTYARQVEWMRALAFDVLDLQRVTSSARTGAA
jgi:hypothetical protein